MLAVVIGVLTACATPGNGGPPADCTTTGQGDLAVSIAAPPGVTPDVLVTGPNAFGQEIAVDTILKDLPAGLYTMTTLRVAGSPGCALVGPAYGALTAPVVTTCVEDAKTAIVARTYASQPGSARLWAADGSDGSVVAFDAIDLAAGGGQTPAAALDLKCYSLNTTDGHQIAFGPTGSLWVSDSTGNNVQGQLLVFFQGKLAAAGAHEPDLVVEAAAFHHLGQLAFDQGGNLWLLNQSGNQLLEYTAAQVRALLEGADEIKVTTQPAHVYDGPEIVTPRALAFDSAGNLWLVADDTAMSASEVRILRYDVAALGSGGAITASLAIGGTTSAAPAWPWSQCDVPVRSHRLTHARSRMANLESCYPSSDDNIFVSRSRKSRVARHLDLLRVGTLWTIRTATAPCCDRGE